MKKRVWWKEENARYRDMQRLCSLRQRQLRRNSGPHERAVGEALHECGFTTIPQKGFLCGGNAVRIVDFYIPKPHRIVVEVDGPSHVGKASLDALREKQICTTHKRIRFARITNAEVEKLTGTELRGLLIQRIEAAKPPGGHAQISLDF